MAEKRGGLFAAPGLRTTVEVSEDGVNYTEVPGCNQADHAPGSREANTIQAFEGTTSVLGSLTIEPVTFAVSAYQPHMPAYRIIDEAFRNSQILNWRIRTPASRYRGPTPAGDTAQIVETTPNAGPIGGVTLALDSAKRYVEGAAVQRGHVLRLDPAGAAILFVIASIDVNSDGQLTDFVPASGTLGLRVARQDGSDVDDVAAAVYELWRPGIQVAFAGEVETPPGFSVGASASTPLSATVTVRPTAPLPRPTLYVA